MQKAMISAGGSSIGQDAMMIYPATELETHPVVSPVSLQLGIVPGGDQATLGRMWGQHDGWSGDFGGGWVSAHAEKHQESIGFGP